MSLTEFIPQFLGFKEKTDAKLEAISKAQSDGAELTKANAALKADLEKSKGETAAALVEITTSKATIATQATEIATLKAAVETERRRANEVIAGQGLDPGKLPTVDPKAALGAPKPKTITEECQAAKAAQVSK